jgi:hypothetical protein
MLFCEYHKLRRKLASEAKKFETSISTNTFISSLNLLLLLLSNLSILLQVECECPAGRAGKLCQLQEQGVSSLYLPRLQEEGMQSDQGGPLPTTEKGVIEFDGKSALSIPNRITKRYFKFIYIIYIEKHSHMI